MQLVPRRRKVANEAEVFRPGLVHRADIARLPLHLGELIPDMVVVGPALGVEVEHPGGLAVGPGFDQGLGQGHGQGVVAGIDFEMAAEKGSRLARLVLADQDFRLGDDIADPVGLLREQPAQGFPGEGVLLVLPISHCEAVGEGVLLDWAPRLAQAALVIRHEGALVRGVMVDDPGPHEPVLKAVPVLPLGIARRPAAGVGHPGFGQRVRKQELRRPAAEPVQRHQALEQRAHAGGVDSGVEHRVLADPVGLGFIAAAVAELVAQRHALGGGDRRGAMLGVGCRHHNHAGEQAGEIGQPARLGFVDAPGEMPLADMGDLVGHHRGEFGFVLSIEEQPGIDPDDATGGREGIQFIAVDNDEGQPVVPQFRARGEPVGDRFEIAVEQGVGNRRRAAADLGEEALPHAVLFLKRHRPGNPVPKRWQPGLGGTLWQNEKCAKQQRERSQQ